MSQRRTIARRRRAALYAKWERMAEELLRDGKSVEQVVDTLVPLVLGELGSDAGHEETIRGALRYLCEEQDHAVPHGTTLH